TKEGAHSFLFRAVSIIFVIEFPGQKHQLWLIMAYLGLNRTPMSCRYLFIIPILTPIIIYIE
ncbi:MAG: hypothetical protein AB1815_08915, partial [Bacillota bacterium]